MENLRDLSLEIEGDDVDGTDKDKAFVRVLAGTAFGIAGEVEEALEILGSETEDLDAYAFFTWLCPPPLTFYQSRSDRTHLPIHKSSRSREKAV